MALQYAAQRAAQSADPARVWVLDSPPGPCLISPEMSHGEQTAAFLLRALKVPAREFRLCRTRSSVRSSAVARVLTPESPRSGPLLIINMKNHGFSRFRKGFWEIWGGISSTPQVVCWPKRNEARLWRRVPGQPRAAHSSLRCAPRAARPKPRASRCAPSQRTAPSGWTSRRWRVCPRCWSAFASALQSTQAGEPRVA